MRQSNEIRPQREQIQVSIIDLVGGVNPDYAREESPRAEHAGAVVCYLGGCGAALVGAEGVGSFGNEAHGAVEDGEGGALGDG